MQGRKFVWKPPSQEKLRQEIRQRKDQVGGGVFDSIVKSEFTRFKPRKGTNNIRFMPPTWDGAEYYAMYIYLHYNVGPDNGIYLCSEKHGEGKCPICEERAKLRGEGDQEAANQLRMQEARIAWVIDREADQDVGPQVYQYGYKMDKAIAALCYEEDGGAICIYGPDDGYDVSFVREGEGIHSAYIGHKISRRQSSISNDSRQQDKWLTYIAENPINEVLNFYPYEHIAKLFQSAAPKRDEDDEPKSLREDLDDEIPEHPRKAAAQDVEEEPPFDPDTGEIKEEVDDRAARREARRASRNGDGRGERPRLAEDSSPAERARRGIEDAAARRVAR